MITVIMNTFMANYDFKIMLRAGIITLRANLLYLSTYDTFYNYLHLFSDDFYTIFKFCNYQINYQKHFWAVQQLFS